jgi:iron complex transport system ATP-binding protein
MKLEATSITVSVGARRIVDSAGLAISQGELVGLIGPNGAGKSTLLRAMLGIRDRVSGTITLDGQDIFSIPPRERAKRVAFLPQDRRVEWRLPVRDVIMLGRYPHHAGFGGATEGDRQAVDRAVHAVGSRDLLDRPIAVLSGGERTLVLLARALAVEAPLLLVDEPTSALDPSHQLQVMEILHALTRTGVGVLAVMHDLALAARFMDRLIMMDRGAVVADGPPSAVLSPQLLDAVYGIDALHGDHAGRPWVLPWSRRRRAES